MNDLSALPLITSHHQVESFSSNCWVITAAMWLHWLMYLPVPAHATKQYPCGPQQKARQKPVEYTNDKGRPRGDKATTWA